MFMWRRLPTKHFRGCDVNGNQSRCAATQSLGSRSPAHTQSNMSACTSQRGLELYNWARLSPSAGHVWYLVERKWRYNTQWVDTNQMAPFPGRSLSAMQCTKRMTEKWQDPPNNNACCWQAVQFPADLLPSFSRLVRYVSSLESSHCPANHSELE
jgi:hypothetical protein